MRVSLLLLAASLALAPTSSARSNDDAPTAAASAAEPAPVERARAHLGRLVETDACFHHLCYFDRRIESRSPGVRIGFSLGLLPIVPGDPMRAEAGWVPIEVRTCDGRRLRTGSLFRIGGVPAPRDAGRPVPLPRAPAMAPPVVPERAPVAPADPAI